MIVLHGVNTWGRVAFSYEFWKNMSLVFVNDKKFKNVMIK